MISAVRAVRCSANGAMIPCSLFTTARIPTILCAVSEDIFLFEYGLNSKIAAVSWTVELTTSGFPIRESFCTNEDRSRGGGGIMDESGKEESY